jgi:hypothetical protein
VNSEIYRDLIEELHVLGEKKAMQYQRISELRGLLSLQLAIAGSMRRELKHIADLLISLSCILVLHQLLTSSLLVCKKWLPCVVPLI